MFPPSDTSALLAPHPQLALAAARGRGWRRLRHRTATVLREVELIERGALPATASRLRQLRAELADLEDSADALRRLPG